MAVAKSILIVDDDPLTHELVIAMLDGPEHYQVDSAHDGKEGLTRLLSCHYDVVLTDLKMPGIDGLTLLSEIQKVCPDTRVVVMTADSTPGVVVQAIRDHAFSLLGKPLSRPTLVETINSAFISPVQPDDIKLVSAKNDWISIELRCKLVIADRLAHFFRELNSELTPDERDSVSTAFRELLLNAIEHGGRSDPEQIVNLTYVRTSRSILYYIRDPGEGFSMSHLPHAAVSNTREQPLLHAEVRNQLGIRPGGFGILLTKNFADELIYSEKGNEVILIKYVQ